MWSSKLTTFKGYPIQVYGDASKPDLYLRSKKFFESEHNLLFKQEQKLCHIVSSL